MRSLALLVVTVVGLSACAQIPIVSEQQLEISALSIANQANQSVLKLFG